MSPKEIKQVLSELGGGGANKTLGQHFLIERAALEGIVAAAELTKDEQVLEIGPGLGVLTRALLEAGARVTAIEQDRRYVAYLQTALASYGDRFTVIHGDAAQVSLASLIPHGPWKLVSNLPYSITSLILREAVCSLRTPDRVVLLIQKEVAERAISVAPKGKTSLLSLMVALSTTTRKIVRRVSPGAFFPPPKVDSAVLLLEPKNLPTIEDVMRVAKRGFAHKRKLLASNLELSLVEKKIMSDITGSEKSRSEELSPEQWALLAQQLAAART